MSSETKKLFETEEALDTTQKEYVIDIFKKMFNTYKEKFRQLGLSDRQLADKFDNNILPGFFDFAITVDHKFGSIIQPEISNYLSIKHGCWLNTIDFATKYMPEKLKLVTGYIVHKNDLEKVKKDLDNDFTPVYIDLIPHGFFVDKDGDVFDPTLGVNEDYHYFYKMVPEEIWKSFKYFYNNPKDWWVADFADWTKEQIRAAKESHEFYKLCGIDFSEANAVSQLGNDTTVDDSIVKVEVRNERGELVDIENSEQVLQPSDRNAIGTVEVRNEKGQMKVTESVALSEDYFDGTIKLDQIPEDSTIDDIMDSDSETNIPDDSVLEQQIDDYVEAESKVTLIRTKSGHLYKKSEDADASLKGSDAIAAKGLTPAGKLSDDGVVIPSLKSDFINTQINNYGNLLKDSFVKAVDEAKELRNTTTTFGVKGLGTLDSAAKTYYPFGRGEKTSRSKSAAGFEDLIPFYLSYFFGYLDEDGKVTQLSDEKIKDAIDNNKKYKVVRTLTLTQPKTVYQYRCQIPNASIFNKPIKIDSNGKGNSTENLYKIPVATNEPAKKFSVMYVACSADVADFIKNSSSGILESGIVNDLSYFYIFKQTANVKDYVKKCSDYFNSLSNKDEQTLLVAEITKSGSSYKFKDLAEEKSLDGCVVHIAQVKISEDFEVKSLDLTGFYIATIGGELSSGFFGDFLFKADDKTSEKVHLNDKPLALSDKLYLYTVEGSSNSDSEENVYKWIVAAPNLYIENGKLSEIKIDEDYNLFQVFAITMKTEYPGKPDKSEYMKSKSAWKIYQWLEKEYERNIRRSEYDNQIHMRRGFLDIERAIPAFSFVKSEIEDFDENKLSIESHKDWIKQVLCSSGSSWVDVKKDNAEGFALNELFVHYAVALNIKLRYFLDNMQYINNAGEKILTTQDYQGIVIDNEIEIGSTVNFKNLDNYIAQVVITNIPKNNELVGAQVEALTFERNENLENLRSEVIGNVQKRVEEVGANRSKTWASKIYVETTENGATVFYVYDNAGEKHIKPIVNFINQVFYKETDSEEEQVVCSYDLNSNIVFESVEDFCKNKEAELASVKASYEKGDHSLYTDVANVVKFGFENSCYSGGVWLPAEKQSIVNLISPYAFGTETYNGLLDRLNTYFRLPESLLPATSNLYDLRILQEKLKDCQNILQNMHEKFKDNKYHLSLKTRDGDSDEGQEFKVKNINEYIKLYSGHEDEKNVDSAQEEDWKRLCQYINFDIYPKIMEDEYNELREVAKSQKRLTQGVKMTVRLKEFVTKVADVPFDFTTKSILFSALKNYGNAKGVSETFSRIFGNVKAGNTENLYGNIQDAYADYSQLDKDTTEIKTSSAFKNNASTRNSVESFLRQFDKLKDSYEYSFLNTLLYTDASDDDIWKMRNEIAKGFGFDLSTEQEKFKGTHSYEDFKECFVKAIKQLLLDYTGYKATKVATLYNRINGKDYSLRDLSSYYKTRMSDITGSLEAFISALERSVKSNRGKELVQNIKIVTGIIHSSKEDRIHAMESIINSSDLLGSKYTWLLAKFDEMTTLYENYKELQKELKGYINAEIKRTNPSDKDLESAGVDFDSVQDEGMNELTSMFLKNIYSTWKISMFDAFKKEYPDDLEKETKISVFDNEQKNPIFLNAWTKSFKLDDESKKKIVAFIDSSKSSKFDLSVLTTFTNDQVASLIDIIKKDDSDYFEKSKKFITTINNLNTTAENENIYSLTNVGKQHNNVKTSSPFYTDTVLHDLTVKNVESIDFWKQFVKGDLDKEKEGQLKLFVERVLQRVGSNKDMLLRLNTNKVTMTLESYFKANEGKDAERIKKNAEIYSLSLLTDKQSQQHTKIPLKVFNK